MRHNLAYSAMKCIELNYHVLFVKQSKEYQSLCFLLPPSVHQVIGHSNIRDFLSQISICLAVGKSSWRETDTTNAWMKTLYHPKPAKECLVTVREELWSDWLKPHVQEVLISISVHLTTLINHWVVLYVPNSVQYAEKFGISWYTCTVPFF